jgi:hypothetical protein
VREIIRVSGFCMNDYREGFGVAKLYFGWILIHYLAVHLYARICVPSTLTGFLMSPLLAPAPHCMGLRWAMNTGGDSITAIWMMCGVYVVKRLNIAKQN